ncbi:MAG: BadF/BadG/BcrA/BcrD ATPase family protein [Arcanobacterium sp.]|nr:BadF/BadG/BcrA/BcrD ATPase family protein [Arcanobacterium sp.]
MADEGEEDMPVFIIGDIGGTSAKLAWADETGGILAEIFGSGANLHSAGGIAAFRRSLVTAFRQLLQTPVCLRPGGQQNGRPGEQQSVTGEARRVSVDEIALVYLAISGAGSASVDMLRRTCQSILNERGISAKLVVCDDILPAFMANAEGEDSGILALSGTGALTAAISRGRIIRRCDGLGWMLGDSGSGLWFGHEALRACANDLDGTGKETYLSELITRELRISRSTQELIAAVSDQPVASWARFAPFVFDALAESDTEAVSIVNRAVARFVTTISLAADALVGATRAADTPEREWRQGSSQRWQERERGQQILRRKRSGENYREQPLSPDQPLSLMWAGGLASHTVFPDLVEAQLAQNGRAFLRLTARSPLQGVLALAQSEHAAERH